MYALASLLLLSLAQSSEGQFVKLDDSVLVEGETGRITCQFSQTITVISTVTWEKANSTFGPATIYTYWVSGPYKVPVGDLINRSDYDHGDHNSTLIIFNVSGIDAGRYICRVDTGNVSYPSVPAIVFVGRRLETPRLIIEPNPVIEEEVTLFICLTIENATLNATYDFKRTDNKEFQASFHQNNGTMTIGQTSRDDMGSYICRVTYEMVPSFWSLPVKLEVYYPPDNVTISLNTTYNVLYAGDYVTVTCTAFGGLPFASSVKWDCRGMGGGNGSLVPHGRVSSFTATVDKSWHGQNCTCSAQQAALKEPSITQVVFNIYWPPTIHSLSLDPSLPWLEANNYSAVCSPTNIGNPTCTYSWLKNNQSLQLESAASNISLYVTKDDHKKELSCILNNLYTENRPGKVIGASAILNVQFAPRVYLQPNGKELTRLENNSLTISCSAESNPEANPQNFHWTHHVNGIAVRERLAEKAWFLELLRKGDAGNYTCEVTVNISHPETRSLTGKEQLTLVVYYLHVTASVVEQEVTEYEMVELACDVEAVPDDVMFFPWIHVNRGDSRYLNSTFQNKTRAVIVFQSIQYYDVGVYSCVAGNSEYQDERADQRVIVRYAAKQPKHPAEGLQVFTGLGKNVVLNITVDAYPREVSFTWRHGQDDNVSTIMHDDCTHNKDDCLESTYSISNVTMNDLGNYMVHANNSILNGSDFHFILTQRESPGPPSIIVERCFSTPVSVEIWWRANHNGGYPQTFSVHYKEPGGEFREFISEIPDKGLDVLHNVRVTPLNPETTYQFKVTAHNNHEGGSHVTSLQEEFTTLMRPRVDNSTLRVSRYGSTAYLTWKRPEGAFDTQRIEQYEIAELRLKRATRTCLPPTCMEHRNMTADVTSYNVSGLEEGKEYRFAIVFFFKGDTVQREEFTEEKKQEMNPTDAPLNTALIAAAAAGGGAALIIIILVIIVIVTCRRKKKTVSQEINGSGKSISLEDLKNNRKSGFDNKGYSKDAVETALPSDNKSDSRETEVGPGDQDVGGSVADKQTDAVTTNPPPGTEGLLYATVEFTESNATDKPKPEKSEKGTAVDSSCEYADIDHTKKTVDTPGETTEVHVDEIPEYAAVDYAKKKKPSLKKGTTKVEEEDAIPVTETYAYAAVDHKKKTLPPKSEDGEQAVPNVENYEYAAVDRTKKKKSPKKTDPSLSAGEQQDGVPNIGNSEYAVVDYSKKTRLSVNEDAKQTDDDVLI